MTGNPKIEKGLEGINVGETKISYIDGIKGILEYRGYDICELVKYSYEHVSCLLIHGILPDEKRLLEFSAPLREARELDGGVINVIKTCNFNIEAMDALRTGISYLSHCDLELNDNSRKSNFKKATNIIAKVPSIVAVFWRMINLDDPIPPDKNLSHGANFLYMLRGTKPTDIEACVIETDFILSAEHELNASTFSARVTASTTSDLYSAIIAAMGTLKGKIHGGARYAVMDLLDQIGDPEKAEAMVLEMIKNKQRIMGFGHRVYKTYDPRAKEFKRLAKLIAEEKGVFWYELGENIEKTVIRELVEKQPRARIYPNVDFWAAVCYKYLNLAPQLATSVFAIGRVSGWIAHCMEQYEDNRLIRPRAVYVGEHGKKPEV